MSAGVVVRHTLRAYFYSSMTLGVAICLHSPQTEVCSPCAGVFLGTTISIAVHCISRFIFLPGMILVIPTIFTALRPESVRCMPRLWTLGSLSTTLGIVVRLCSPQTEVCPLRAKIPSWLQPSASSSITSQQFNP